MQQQQQQQQVALLELLFLDLNLTKKTKANIPII
jgi:hypothetical protein